MKTAIVLFACGTLSLLSSGCSMLPRTTTIPSPTVPHRVAEEATVKIYVRRPDGQLTVEAVRLPSGWWIAGPPVIEPMPELGLSPKVDP